jgi:hypothetical protein
MLIFTAMRHDYFRFPKFLIDIDPKYEKNKTIAIKHSKIFVSVVVFKSCSPNFHLFITIQKTPPVPSSASQMKDKISR